MTSAAGEHWADVLGCDMRADVDEIRRAWHRRFRELTRGELSREEFVERLARIDRALADAEMEIAEEQALREAAELEARGMPEAAEERVSAPIILPAVKEAPKPVAEGTSTRKKYGARVTDLGALIRAVAEGKATAGMVIPNQSALDALARSLGETFSMPGVELTAETIVSAKGR